MAIIVEMEKKLKKSMLFGRHRTLIVRNVYNGKMIDFSRTHAPRRLKFKKNSLEMYTFPNSLKTDMLKKNPRFHPKPRLKYFVFE